MKFRMMFAGGFLLAMAAVTVLAAEAVNLDGIKCVLNPKAAARADKSLDYKGGKIYFCCDNCPKKFDAGKNAVAANHQLAATHQAIQEKCPLSGEPCNEANKVTVAGVDVAFCCPDCQGTVSRAKGEEQLKMVFSNDAFSKAFVVKKKK